MILLVTSFIVGLIAALLAPVVQAVTANTVQSQYLPSAISLQAMASNASRVLGPKLAAPLVSNNLFEISWSLYGICAGLALVAAAGITLFPYQPDQDSVPILHRLLDGVLHAREKKPAGSALYSRRSHVYLRRITRSPISPALQVMPLADQQVTLLG